MRDGRKPRPGSNWKLYGAIVTPRYQIKSYLDYETNERVNRLFLLGSIAIYSMQYPISRDARSTDGKDKKVAGPMAVHW